MDRQITWVKQAVGLCLENAGSGELRQKLFQQQEQLYLEFTDSEKYAVRKIMQEGFQNKDLIYIFSHFIQNMKAADFGQGLMEAISKETFDPYTGTMLEVQVRRMVAGEYARKRELHKKNVEGFKEALHMHFPYVPAKKRNQNRIVIITEQILSLLHAPTKLVLETAYALQEKLGYEVLIFICPCDGSLPKDLWHKPTSMNTQEKFRNHAMEISYRGAMFQEFQIDLHPWNLKEYQMMLEIIHAWNPFFVFGLGVLNPVADLCGAFTDLAMRAVSTECPVSEAGILVRPMRQAEEMEQEYAKGLGDGQEQLFIKEKAPVVVGQGKNQYSRSGEGLPEDKFLIAIVGNRLDAEIDMEFAALMQGIVQKAPGTAFVVIGEVGKMKNYFQGTCMEGHIFYLGYRRDLVGTYGMVDLYLNPRRMGGGYSSVMALAAAVPVVSLPGCDVAGHVGEEFLVKDYQEMEEMVLRYEAEPEFYKEKQECAKKKMEENTEGKMVQYVQHVVNGIISLIEGRNQTDDCV